jgi:hypothetical protein
MLERRRIQNAKTENHLAFNGKAENQPFFWLESAYNLFTSGESSKKEIKYLIGANVLLSFACFPALIIIIKFIFI